MTFPKHGVHPSSTGIAIGGYLLPQIGSCKNQEFRTVARFNAMGLFRLSVVRAMSAFLKSGGTADVAAGLNVHQKQTCLYGPAFSIWKLGSLSCFGGR